MPTFKCVVWSVVLLFQAVKGDTVTSQGWHTIGTRGPTEATAAGCADKLPDCAQYGAPDKICNDAYMQQNCQEYCGYCGDGLTRLLVTKGTTRNLFVPTKATHTTVKECYDKIKDCDSYGAPTYACHGNYRQWAEQHCPEYCGFCTWKANQVPTKVLVPTRKTVTPQRLVHTTKIVTPQHCVDTIGNCHAYQTKCTSHHSYAWSMRHCAKSCGFCGSTTGVVSTTSTTTTTTQYHPTAINHHASGCQTNHDCPSSHHMFGEYACEHHRCHFHRYHTTSTACQSEQDCVNSQHTSGHHFFDSSHYGSFKCENHLCRFHFRSLHFSSIFGK